MNRLRILLIAAVVWGFPAAPLLAVGMSIQPARLTLSAEWGSTAFGELLVTNITGQPAMYQVQADEREEVQAQPPSFRLDPGDQQLVSVTYTPRSFLDRRTLLNIVARPLDAASVTLASGVRYPLTLVATSRWVNMAVRGSLIAVVVALALLLGRRRAPVPL